MSIDAAGPSAFWSSGTAPAWVESCSSGADQFLLVVGYRREAAAEGSARLRLRWRGRGGAVIGRLGGKQVRSDAETVAVEFIVPASMLAEHPEPLEITTRLIEALLFVGEEKLWLQLPDFVRFRPINAGGRTVAPFCSTGGHLYFRNSRVLGPPPAREQASGARPPRKVMILCRSVRMGGGKTKAMFQLARELARGGHQVCITALWFEGKAPKYRFPENVGFDFIEGFYKSVEGALAGGPSSFSAINERFTARTDARLAAYLRDNRFDVIYTPNYDSPLYRAIAEHAHPQTALILGDHNPRRPERLLAGRLQEDFVWGARAFDAVHVVNPLIGELVQPLTPKEVFTIPNMVDLEAPIPRGDEFFATRKMVSIGRLNNTKRMSHVIEAFAKICDDFPEWTLDIFGSGENMDALVQLIERLGRQSRITMRGFDPQVTEFLRSGAVFVSASAAEAHPLVLIEAAVAGCPIISYDQQYGAKYLIRHDETGYLAKDADKNRLARMMAGLMSRIQDRDPQVLEVIKAAGERSKEFNRQHISELWLERIETLCREKASASGD